jgi:hypothetical protein
LDRETTMSSSSVIRRTSLEKKGIQRLVGARHLEIMTTIKTIQFEELLCGSLWERRNKRWWGQQKVIKKWKRHRRRRHLNTRERAPCVCVCVCVCWRWWDIFIYRLPHFPPGRFVTKDTLILIDIFFNVFLSQGFSLLFVKEEEKKKKRFLYLYSFCFFWISLPQEDGDIRRRRRRRLSLCQQKQLRIG